MFIFINLCVTGLDDTLLPYIHFLLKHGVNGHRLLDITVEDLPIFRVEKLGHQELLMGAIDLLREFVGIWFYISS